MVITWLTVLTSILITCDGHKHKLVALYQSEDGWECDAVSGTDSALTGSTSTTNATIEIEVLGHHKSYKIVTKSPHRSSHCEGIKNDNTEIYLVVQTDTNNFAIEGRMVTVPSVRNQVTTQSNHIIHRTMQLAGLVEEQPNVVFLSSGYLEGDHEAFFRDVVKAIDGVMGIEPYGKYMGLWNIYAVFQPSPELGASQPNIGLSVDNNLDCSYGESTVRALSCRTRLVTALAATAPSVDSRIVIVNDAVYGGTGGSNTAVVYNGEHMASVLAHELGHSIADLSDEYDFRIFESNQIPLSNCWSGHGDIPWSHWIDEGAVLQPTPVCGYSNYYKPTDEQCIMFSTIGESFCPVCKEVLTRSLYLMKPNIKIGSPRCPLSPETVILNSSTSTVKLNVNPRWGRRIDVSITWKVNGTTIKEEKQSDYTFNAASYGSLIERQEDTHFEVTATIIDDAPGIMVQRPDTLVGTETFNIIYTTKPAKYDCQQRSCDGLFGGTEHCSVCEEGVNCTITAQFHHYEPPLNLGKAFKEALAEMSGITLAIVTGVGVFVCGGWCLIRSKLANEEGFDIEEFTAIQTYMHRYLLLLSITFLMGCAAVMVYLIYVFQYKEDGVGETFFIVTMAACGGYLILRLVVLSAVCCKSRALFAVGALVLFAEEGTYCFFLIMVNMYVKDLWGKHENVAASLREHWEKQVSKNPELICAVQRNLGCSGWLRACYNSPNVFYCPASCERSNSNTEPCSEKLEKWFCDNYTTLMVVFMLMSVLFLVAFVSSIMLACTVRFLDESDVVPSSKPKRRPRRAWESVSPPAPRNQKLTKVTVGSS